MFKLLRRLRRKPQFDRSRYDTLFEDDSLIILAEPAVGSHCVVSFTGVGYAIGGIDLQRPELSSGKISGSKVFVIDKSRSWGNAIDWALLESVVLRFAAGQEIVTIGNSMGGFLAVLASSRLSATHAVAFAPQWSVDPRIVPEENRWGKYVTDIKTFQFPDLRKSFDSNCQYSIIFGDVPADSLHFDLFKEFTVLAPDGNIAFLLVRGADHRVAQLLKEKEALYAIVIDCLTSKSDFGWLRQQNVDFEFSRRTSIV